MKCIRSMVTWFSSFAPSKYKCAFCGRMTSDPSTICVPIPMDDGK